MLEIITDCSAIKIDCVTYYFVIMINCTNASENFIKILTPLQLLLTIL